ncbi:MAG TPA: hypothetical protein VFF66_09260 [Brevundimonas sp.]|nr:hypothetical protein [Brevundimonas sp.]
MTQLKTLFTVAALAAGMAACNNPESAPEPENEVVAETMPDTPDAAAMQDAAAAGSTGLTPPAAEEAVEPQEPAPAG